MPVFAEARRNMIECQLRPNRIMDERVLEAMTAVPREAFVPKSHKGVAYADEDLRLPDGRRLIEPLTLARMLQHSAIGPGDVVLTIGCDTGYAAAVTARLAGTAIVLERDPAMAEQVQAALDASEVANAVVAVVDEPLAGHPDQAPYDVVLLLGSLASPPLALGEQVSEGGRIAAVLDRGHIGKLMIWTKVGGVLGGREIADAQIPPLPVAHKEPSFVF